jgi:regulator of replication initiation timing
MDFDNRNINFEKEHDLRIIDLENTVENLKKEVRDLEEENKNKEFESRKNRTKLELTKVVDHITEYDKEMKAKKETA